MIPGPDNVFALPPMADLLRRQLALLPARAARQPAGRSLLVSASAEARATGGGDTGHLKPVRLHVEAGRLGGDVVCAPDALPWEDDAFRLVVMQHASDLLGPSEALLDELARILMPGGVLLWFGLNPWSPWWAWLHWQARAGLPVPRAMSADLARRRLLRRDLAPVGLDYFGPCWPGHDVRVPPYAAALLTPLRAAYLLTASKQRAVLTPLRPRRARAPAYAQPQLAASRRACA